MTLRYDQITKIDIFLTGFGIYYATVLVMTVQKPRNRELDKKGTSFLHRTISEKTMSGLKSVWRGQVKIFDYESFLELSQMNLSSIRLSNFGYI